MGIKSLAVTTGSIEPVVASCNLKHRTGFIHKHVRLQVKLIRHRNALYFGRECNVCGRLAAPAPAINQRRLRSGRTRVVILKLRVHYYVFRWNMIIAGGAVSRHRLWDYRAASASSLSRPAHLAPVPRNHKNASGITNSSENIPFNRWQVCAWNLGYDFNSR